MEKNGKKWKYLDTLNNDFVHINSEVINKIENECCITEADAADLFIIENHTFFLEQIDLIPSRCRINGVINASKRMLEAKKGTRSKRAAILVRYDTDIEKYIIIDGNSTFFVCKLWKIKNIPCKLKK